MIDKTNTFVYFTNIDRGLSVNCKHLSILQVLDDEVTPPCNNVVFWPSQLPSVAAAPAAPSATVPSSLQDIQLMINQAMEKAFLSSSAFIQSID